MAATGVLESIDSLLKYVESCKTEEAEEVVETTSKQQLIEVPTGYRTHTCGQLRLGDVGKTVTITGWVQKSRSKKIVFTDLRDRYGITQCIFPFPENDEDETVRSLNETAAKLGREDVVQVTGKVVERSNKNPNRLTGEVEIVASVLNILNQSADPPFKIQDKTDGNEQIRMKYRYLDIRRNPVKEALLLRNRITRAVRNYLGDLEFCEIETPYLIKSTPEGARDFVVPSRMNPGQFYALPQSPQTFKQILMVAGMDRYFQIVKCFRDEELRADRQPEFTQIDCEMAFVEQEDVLTTFEGMVQSIFRDCTGTDFNVPFERLTWHEAMEVYGIDKPDLRYGMKLHYITDIVKGCGVGLIDDAEAVIAIKLDGVSKKGEMYASNKKIKKGLEKIATGQKVGAGGCIWCKVEEKKLSTNMKKLSQDQLKAWAEHMNAEPGDLMVAFAGPRLKTQEIAGKMRAEMGTNMGLRTPEKGFYPLWVVDFPMFEWDEEENRYTAMHHPFTSPKNEDMHLMETDPGAVRANAYDCVLNGVEMGGGSIRIHDQALQNRVFELLGFTQEEADEQFGFLLNAFTYGAPPHGGLAFGLDRMCQLVGGACGMPNESIRDYIAFPKNNQGRDVMISSPSEIDQKQLEELSLDVNIRNGGANITAV